MARALSRRMQTAASTNFALPFETSAVAFPVLGTMTDEGRGQLLRPFTSGADTGPSAFQQAPGYNYVRDYMALDLPFPADPAFLSSSFSPITV